MTSQSETSEERLSSLRGAQVAEVNPARLRAVAAGLCVVALAAAVAVLFVAGAHRNAQVATLHDDGVPVTVTVTGCQGLLGGSGSNPVGYACRGTFIFQGHRYDDAIPGDVLHPPGTHVAAVADPSDPGLLTTARAAKVDQPTAKVYVLPSVLLVVLLGLVATIGLVHRRSRSVRAGGAGRSVMAHPLNGDGPGFSRPSARRAP